MEFFALFFLKLEISQHCCHSFSSSVVGTNRVQK